LQKVQDESAKQFLNMWEIYVKTFEVKMRTAEIKMTF